jgi:farnesyl-diphosphate farnesyltransferase
MNCPAAFSDRELMALLTGVSRSFVLTIRALPRSLRRPIGLAYLLARATDTIADTSTAPVQTRIDSLRAFNLHALPDLSQILPASESEQTLLNSLPRITAALDTLPPSDHAHIQSLLEKITRGQELDLLRFPDPHQIRALETAAQLDEYTYLVAGCVGEFWTRICSSHLPRYARLDPEPLAALGRSFGQGLQLVNILRDLPEDIRNGRCYLPADELCAIGIRNPETLRQDLRAAAPVFESWRQKALRHHEDARRYIEALRPLRIRFACLLPWSLGVRTLNLLGTKSPLETSARIKVTRKEVTQIIRRSLWAALSNQAISRCPNA